ncbi:MAG TPA: hypothetical protein VLK23_06490 [Thermodesulfobacteriota bacterium]|nr:hypothetical protein [Thermodesulfobacteriota bacterium]
MEDRTDVHHLPDEEIKLVREFVEFLREKERMKRQQKKKGRKERIGFATWPLGIKSKLSRKEIYDYL